MSSGVYSKTFGDICRSALRDAGIVAVEMPTQPKHFEIAQTTANDVLAHWQSQGIHLWSETEALMPLNPNQTEYSLGPNGAHCFTNYVYTTLSSGASSGSTNLSVGTTSGMTEGDFIGVFLDDKTRHWTTIQSITDSTNVVLTAGLASSASSGNGIYTYTTKIDRPLRILDVRHASEHYGNELWVLQESRQQYFRTPNKYNATSIVSNWYYSPQLDNGKMLMWPTADSAQQVLRFTFVKPQYVNSDQSEQVLIPSEWYLPFKWAVAYELAVTYAVDPNRLISIAQKAQDSLQKALDNDVEIDYFSIQPG